MVAQHTWISNSIEEAHLAKALGFQGPGVHFSKPAKNQEKREQVALITHTDECELDGLRGGLPHSTWDVESTRYAIVTMANLWGQ